MYERDMKACVEINHIVGGSAGATPEKVVENVRSYRAILNEEKAAVARSRDEAVASLRAQLAAANEARAALEKALALARPFVEHAAESEMHYGYFLGGDPRKFSPDPDCSTEEERAQHKADSEAWDRGETTTNQVMRPIDPARSIAAQIKGADSAMLVRDAEGNVTGGHVHKAGYGLGTSELVDPEAVEALAAIDAALPKED